MFPTSVQSDWGSNITEQILGRVWIHFLTRIVASSSVNKCWCLISVHMEVTFLDGPCIIVNKIIKHALESNISAHRLSQYH